MITVSRTTGEKKKEDETINDEYSNDQVTLGYVFFGGRPRFFFVADSPTVSTGAAVLLLAAAGPSSFCLDGRPRRLRLAGRSSVSASSDFFSLRGLPRFFLIGVSEEDTAGAVDEDGAPDFLFLLPLGRPRPRLGFGSLDSATPSTSSGLC